MADEEDTTPAPPPTLPDSHKEEIMGIFKQFDIDGNGLIPLAQLASGTMSVGGKEVSVLNTLAAMDFNGDGFVEESEWTEYFANIAAAMSAEDLSVVLTDLSESGR